MKSQNYKTETKVFYASGWIETGCNAISFFNSGATGTIMINNFPVPFGSLLIIEGNEGEYTDQEYWANFGSAPGPLYVVKKINSDG